MTIYWTDFAKSRLSEIFDFYKRKAGLSVARKLVSSLINHTKGLENQPMKGQLEELLLDRPHGFRYLVFKSYKLIYWVNTSKNRIEIVHVFDTRQNPMKIQKIEGFQ
jgi:toxin ParE1/3/4